MATVTILSDLRVKIGENLKKLGEFSLAIIEYYKIKTFEKLGEYRFKKGNIKKLDYFWIKYM